jgi:hypothetical protein
MNLSNIFCANLLIDIMMITKTEYFLKKVIQTTLLLEALPLCISPAILFTLYLYAEPVNIGACLMNNQEYLCLVFKWN